MNCITLMDWNYEPCTSGSSRERGVDKSTFSPVPFHTQKIRGSGAGPRNLPVKIPQSEAGNVPFKANVWDWTGIDVSGGSLKPNLSEFVQRQTSGSPRLSFSLWQDLVLSPLVARLQGEDIRKCKELAGESAAARLGETLLLFPSRIPRDNCSLASPPALRAAVPLTDLTNRPPIPPAAPRRAGRGWIGWAWRAACSAPTALWLVAAAAGAGRVRRRGGAAGSRGRAGGCTAAGG